MPSGIRATVQFTDGEVCPLAAISADAETTVRSVRANVRSSDDAACVTEFALDAPADVDADLVEAFSYGSGARYRRVHDEGVDCPCECLGRFGCPVDRYVARDGRLTLSFHATDYEQLQAVVADLRERFPDTDVTRLVRSPVDDPASDGVFVDRGKLTARQREVLETAVERGYFERPRGANATEIAADLDVAPSTFREHLAAAQRKLFDDLL